MVNFPFTQRRTVKWGECDPAGIVYTPRFLDWTVEAVEAAFRAIAGITWPEVQARFGLGAPMRQASLDFASPLRAYDDADLAVTVDSLGTSSIGYRVTTRRPDGTLCFTGLLTSVMIDLRTFRPVAIPADIRAPFERYIAGGGGTT